MEKDKKTRQLAKSNNRCELLSHTTDAEKACYDILSKAGYKVIRQQPVYTGRKVFYLDLYIPSMRLAIECDGGYHFNSEQKRKDSNRSACLRRLGIHVYRLTNHDARNPKKVIGKVRAFIKLNSLR